MKNINGATVDNAEDLDLVMPMYNLVEYSSPQISAFFAAANKMWR